MRFKPPRQVDHTVPVTFKPPNCQTEPNTKPVTAKPPNSGELRVHGVHPILEQKGTKKTKNANTRCASYVFHVRPQGGDSQRHSTRRLLFGSLSAASLRLGSHFVAFVPFCSSPVCAGEDTPPSIDRGLSRNRASIRSFRPQRICGLTEVAQAMLTASIHDTGLHAWGHGVASTQWCSYSGLRQLTTDTLFRFDIGPSL